MCFKTKAIEDVVYEITVFGLKTRMANSLGDPGKYAFLEFLHGGFDRHHARSMRPRIRAIGDQQEFHSSVYSFRLFVATRLNSGPGFTTVVSPLSEVK